MSLLQHLKNFFLVFDPGRLQLRSAVRGTLAVIVSYFVLASIARRFGSTQSLAFLGVLMTLLSNLVVNDTKIKDQKVSHLLLLVPTSIAATISILLSESAQARLAMFLIVTFIGVSARRFGPRYVGMGTITFMTYFSTLFFPFHIKDLPLLVPSIVFAIGLAYVARFWLLPDRPHRLLSLYIKAFDLKVDGILRQLADALRSSAHSPRLERGAEPNAIWKEIRTAFIQTNELSLTIEQFFDANEGPSIRSRSDGFRLKAFEQEVALRRLWDYAFEFLHSETPDPKVFQLAAATVDALRDKAPRDQLMASLHALEKASHDENIPPFIASVKNVLRVMENQEFKHEDIVTAVEDIKTKPTSKILGKSSRSAIMARIDSLHTNTRQAIQATLATAIASLLGTTISPQRWYWASVAAFTVFIGATRGETMVRGVFRIIGTVLGLVLGFTLAFASSGHPGLEWTLIVICVFFAIFGARMTFGFWTASLFSSMFALLYDILGLLTKDILVLRIEETLVGAVIGVVVAAIVLPTSTHTVVREALVDYLRNLKELVLSLPQETPNRFSRRNIIRKLRMVDKDLLAVRVATQPILGRGSLMRQGELPSALHDATMLSHFIRHLAISVDPYSEMSSEDFDDACKNLGEMFDDVSELIRDGKRRPRETLPWSGKPSKNMNGPRHSLERIRVSLASLASRKL